MLDCDACEELREWHERECTRLADAGVVSQVHCIEVPKGELGKAAADLTNARSLAFVGLWNNGMLDLIRVKVATNEESIVTHDCHGRSEIQERLSSFVQMILSEEASG